MSFLCRSSNLAGLSSGWSLLLGHGRRAISSSVIFSCAEVANPAAPAADVSHEGKKQKSGRRFMKQKDKRYIVQSQRARNSDLEARADAEGLGWREVAAWCDNIPL